MYCTLKREMISGSPPVQRKIEENPTPIFFLLNKCPSFHFLLSLSFSLPFTSVWKMAVLGPRFLDSNRFIFPT
jgi:hypothetical protein